MRALWIALILGVAALSGPVIAQLPQVPQGLGFGQGFAQDQATPTPPPTTKFERLDQSLEQLLNSGYQIRTTAMGVLVLAKSSGGDKASWVMCSFDVAEGLVAGIPGNYKAPSAACFALN